MKNNSSHPADEAERFAHFEQLTRQARNESPPRIDVVASVMGRIAREERESFRRFPLLASPPRGSRLEEGGWFDLGLRGSAWAAAASAALMLFSVWWGYSSLQMLSDPAGMWVRSPSLAWRALDV
ncbi:MAG: hypothetical protein C0478_02320 [Planctomyces sp.]|nr:hypothetical protein [Planctomyces sp.]